MLNSSNTEHLKLLYIAWHDNKWMYCKKNHVNNTMLNNKKRTSYFRKTLLMLSKLLYINLIKQNVLNNVEWVLEILTWKSIEN